MSFVSNQITYLIDKAIMLSAPYEEQIAGRAALGDYLTDDIANEWIDEDVYLLKDLVEKGIVNESVLVMYVKIVDNFTSASLGEKMYDNTIWTLTGLESAPFWKKQRELASELLSQLNELFY